MRLLRSENSSKYITYREGERQIDGEYQTCLHLTVHDKNISKDGKKNACAKVCISFKELLDYTMQDIQDLLTLKLHKIKEEEKTNIRNQAIKEFAQNLHELCGFEIDNYQYPYLLHESRIDEIAEKLKGK